MDGITKEVLKHEQTERDRIRALKLSVFTWCKRSSVCSQFGISDTSPTPRSVSKNGESRQNPPAVHQDKVNVEEIDT